MVTQKITGTEVTKFDDDFSKLEKASDIYIDLQVKPNFFFPKKFILKISKNPILCGLLMKQPVFVISTNKFVTLTLEKAPDIFIKLHFESDEGWGKGCGLAKDGECGENNDISQVSCTE